MSVQSNYPRWAWLDGQIIENNQKNYGSLLTTYREFYEAFESRDRDKLLELHVPRSEEYAIANYWKGGVDAGHDFMNTGKILDKHGVELRKFSAHQRKLDIYANGKMARLINFVQYHPVVFQNKEKGLIHKLKFGFYKNKQGEWVMIR